MIRNTFLFLEKVKHRKEQNLWKQGIRTWTDFLNAEIIKNISPIKKAYFDRKIKEAQQALREENSSYFKEKLPKKEMWRLYPEFKEECCFLDVEIDNKRRVILVGISNYYNSNFFVHRINLEHNFLQEELDKYKLLITFNGSSFDLPLLDRQLNIEIKIPHIDLKPLCVKLGLKGGLKEVENILNLKRPAHLYGSPVDLWKAFHASGDKEYLDLLIDYNREDIENLKLVMDHCYKKMKESLNIYFDS